MKAKIILMKSLSKIELTGFTDMVDAIAFKGLLKEHLPSDVDAYLDTDTEDNQNEE